MKKLYLIRHAKSSWKDLSLEDFDRPLNKRGKSDSVLMGKLLKRKNIKPDLIISSPAKRALKTTIAVAKQLSYPIEKVIFDIKIYEASIYELLKIIKNIDENNKTIFLVGHNPSINLLVDYLAVSNSIENVVTTGIVEFEFECKWSEIDKNMANLLSFEYPKRYY